MVTIVRLLVLLCLAAAVVPATAAANSMLLGSTALAANSGAPALLSPAGAPVFQGDAGPGYVLAATASGSITSWSFRTAGVNTGNRFELAVLSPVNPAGTDWRLIAVSAPEAVTSASGTDAVMGPFTVNPGISVQPGDRIGLLPLDSGDTPIEQGVNGTDGIRYFDQAFSGGLGASQTISNGSSMDNGQIVPIQATIDTGTGNPTGGGNPTGTGNQTISGIPKAGQKLTCNPGGLAGSPGLTETWYLTTWTVSFVGSGKFRHVVFVPDITAVASGPSYVVPDLPPGDAIGCTVSAGTVSGSAPDVTVQASIPGIARRLPRAYPRITPGVGFGGTNYCTPGRWVHFPTSFSYAWYIEGTRFVGLHNRFSKLVGTGQTLKISALEEQHHLVCRVTARNAAGSGQADSNNYLVPQHAPRAQGPPRVRFLGPECELCNPYPKTSPTSPLQAVNGIFFFSCTPPKFDTANLVVTYSWEIDWPPQSLPGGPLYPGGTLSFSGQSLNIETTTSSRHAIAYSVTPKAGQALGEVVVYGSVKCIVNAHPRSNPNAETDLVSQPLYFREGSG